MMEEKTLDQDLGFNFADFFGQTAGTKDKEAEPKKEYNMLGEEVTSGEEETAPGEEKSAEESPAEEKAEEAKEEKAEESAEEKAEEAKPAEEAKEPEDLDEAVNMILETISQMDVAAEQSTAEVKDKVEEVKDAASAMQEAGEEDYQTLYTDFSKKVDELNEIIIDKDVENEKMRRENAKLARFVEELTKERDDREFSNMQNKGLIDTIEKDGDVKGFVKLYTGFKGGDEGLRESFTDSVSKIVKDTLGVDLKELLKQNLEKDKNMVIEGSAGKEISKSDKSGGNVFNQMIPGF